MSIFEPIAPERGPEDNTVEQEAVDQSSGRRSFDPRSIQIAGLVTVGLVILGLVVSNAAKPEPEPRPAVVSRTDPGAAAIELAESAPSSPADPPVVPPEGDAVPTSAPPADDAEAGEPDDDARLWQDELEDRWERRGNGNGNGFGRWR